MNCIYGRTIYTGKNVIENSYVVFDGGVIKDISRRKKGTLEGSYEVITPAFIDAHSHIGMDRAAEPGSESEANEKMDPFTVIEDALDSVQMDDASFRDSIEQGILYSCTVPGSGNILCGYSAVIKNYARNTSEALVARAGLKAAFGYNPMSTTHWKGQRPYTRMGALAMLRKKLGEVRIKTAKHARARGKAKRDIDFTAEEETLRSVLQGRMCLRVHVHKTDDIAALLRIVDEFGLKVTVEHACDVHDGHVFRELKKRRIPVVYGPLDSFAYKVELKHENWRNIGCLLESGVEFGLMTDHPVILQKTLLLTLRWFLRFGCSRQEAIGIITAGNARILGIDNILGTLEKKKWASFTCWNGDPFDLASYPVAVYGEGNMLYSGN